MRLSDEIFRAVGGPNDEAMAGAITAFSKHLALAECFELSPDIIAACNEVSCSKPSSILSAMEFTRLPYSHTWIEWVTINDPDRLPPTIGKPRPDRIGCLITAFDDSLKSGSMNWAWISHKESFPLMICPYCIMFDWAEDLSDRLKRIAGVISDLPETVTGKMRDAGLVPDGEGLKRAVDAWVPTADMAGQLMKAGKRWNRIADDPIEREAARQLSRHEFLMATMYCAQMHIMLRGVSDDAMRQMSQSWVEDLEGEYPFMVSFITLLNAKNALTLTREDLSRLNKARAKANKQPLREFITTRLSLSKVNTNRAGALGWDRAAARRHLVRGHFKTRKSGIYWWSPYARGHGDVALRLRYAVRP